MNLTDRTRSVLIALGFAVAAAVIITLAVKNSGGGHKGTTKPAAGTVTVFVASRDITANTPGSEVSALSNPIQVAKDAVVAGAISNKAQIEGLVSTATIYQGEQITIRRFQAQQAEGIPGQITGTTRAVQVPGDANQLLVGTLHAGDHVDVLANIKYTFANFHSPTALTAAEAQQAQANLVATRIVLRNLLVLRDPGTPPGASKFGGGGSYQILLAVTDSQARKLYFAMRNADFTLELRPGHGATDGPESVETVGSVLIDGLRRPQFLQLVFGPTVPQ